MSTLLFLLLGFSVHAETRGFPYIYSAEVNPPPYGYVRVEGVDHEALAANRSEGYKYLLKYIKKKFSAPPEEFIHFQHQRHLQQALSELSPPTAQTMPVAFVGDIMWIEDGWRTFLDQELRQYLERYPMVFGNLETPISERFQVPTAKLDFFAYNSPPDLIRSFFRWSGGPIFTVLSLANNHVFDTSQLRFKNQEPPELTGLTDERLIQSLKGDLGLADTMGFLEKQRIMHAGISDKSSARDSFLIFARDGFKIGYYATSWGYNKMDHVSQRFRNHVIAGLSPEVNQHGQFTNPNLGPLRDALAAMTAAGVDIKIVGIHWGYEAELYPSPRQMQIAREIVALGADVIAGSGPHVLQPMEICFVNGYENRYAFTLPAMRHGTGCLLQVDGERARKSLVIYSMGNFTTNMITDADQIGMIARLRWYREPTGELDWILEKPALVYNRIEKIFEANLNNNRRLLLWDKHQIECERARGCGRAKTWARYYKEHVWEARDFTPEPPPEDWQINIGAQILQLVAPFVF